jgi:hypothetical protein
MKTLKVWDIQIWDGGDRCNHAFYVTSKTEADLWKQKNTYDTVNDREFEIYDTIEEYLEGKSEKTRERALAKLTPIERKSLGF